MINKYKKYIVKSILTILAITGVVSATTLADDYMYVKAAHLNVRAAGTIKSKIVATVDNGYKVTVLESLTNGWKKVLLENGQTGYVNGGYLVAGEPTYEKVSSARYTIKSGTAFMRGFDLVQKVAVLNQGDMLEVTSEKIYLNRWIQVRVISAKHPRYIGRTGYVAKRLLSTVDGFEYVAPVVEEPIVEAPVVEEPIVEAPVVDEEILSDVLPELNSAPADTGSGTDDGAIDDEFSKLFEGL